MNDNEPDDDGIKDLLDELDGKKQKAEKPKEEKKKIPNPSIVAGTIEIEKIKFNERNRPIDNERIQELMESIQTFGLLVPIIINKENELLDGERRVRACQAIGLKEIPFIRRKEGFDEASVIANYIRENLSVEQVAWILKEQEGTQEEISKKFGISQGRISQLIGKRIYSRIERKSRKWTKPRHVKRYILPENVSVRVQKHAVEIVFKLNDEMIKNPLKSMELLWKEVKDFEGIVSDVRTGKAK